MEKIKLLDNWKFCKGVGSSLKIMEMSGKAPAVVTLPHDAMIYEKRTKAVSYTHLDEKSTD